MNAETPIPIIDDMAPASKTASSWQVVAAAVRGARHEGSDIPCQDACRWRMASEDVLIAAVADGASSAAHSEIGSAVATQAAINTLCAAECLPNDPHDLTLWEQHLTDALKAAVISIQNEASSRLLPVRDLATTLILVVATPQVTVAVQVGDGAVVVGDRDGNLIALRAAPVGDYVNETDFLCSPNLLKVAQDRFWPVAPRFVAIFSDGLQRLALQMPEANPHPAFFSPLFKFVSETTELSNGEDQLKTFLQSPRLRARTDDDATLLLAYRPGE